jgi:hypothetical protein
MIPNNITEVSNVGSGSTLLYKLCSLAHKIKSSQVSTQPYGSCSMYIVCQILSLRVFRWNKWRERQRWPPHIAMLNTNRIFKICVRIMCMHFFKFSEGHCNVSLLYLTDSGPPSHPCTLWKQALCICHNIIFWQE